jgi:hypothetical protein
MSTSSDETWDGSKKQDLLGGMTAPGYFTKREDLLSQILKTLEPLPHTYTTTPQLMRERPWVGLDLCFSMGQTRGFFFNLDLEICSHWESNPGPGRCRRSLQPLG